MRYLLCGGLAVNIYGVPRMTADIDLILDFDYENLKQFEICVVDAFYQSQIPISLSLLSAEQERIKLIKEKNLIAFSYFNTKANIMSMDVLIDIPLGFAEMWERKTTRTTEDIDVHIVSVDDLIKLKEYSNRKQDIDDIYLLSQLKK
ncbi:MAG: hypothetical protein MUC81_14035 [Bacteroidia bacterium]|nr:hypothetical protein [Bacteroidia bacterium]